MSFFANELQRTIHGQVVEWLADLFGEQARPRPEEPTIDLFVGSACAQVLIVPWTETEGVITVRSWVVSGARQDPELHRWLLQENNSMLFGAFGLDEDGHIYLEHSILASTCDPEEIKASAEAVVHLADRYDDIIVERWGGRRAIDEQRSTPA